MKKSGLRGGNTITAMIVILCGFGAVMFVLPRLISDFDAREEVVEKLDAVTVESTGDVKKPIDHNQKKKKIVSTSPQRHISHEMNVSAHAAAVSDPPAHNNAPIESASREERTEKKRSIASTHEDISDDEFDDDSEDEEEEHAELPSRKKIAHRDSGSRHENHHRFREFDHEYEHDDWEAERENQKNARYGANHADLPSDNPRQREYFGDGKAHRRANKRNLVQAADFRD